MKNNPPPKASPGKSVVESVENTVAGHDEAIPPGLEYFAQLKNLSPIQQFATILPKFAEATKTQNPVELSERFAGFFAGMGVDLGVPLPDWVKLASEKAWRGMGLDFLHALKDAPQPSAIGKLVELMDLWLADSDPTPDKQAAQAIQNFTTLIKSESGNLTAEEQLQYAKGRTAIPKLVEKVENPTERTLAFLAISTSWREVEKLGSRNKTFKWLKEARSPKGEKLLSDYTGWDEVKDWLAEIRLPKGKAGRPKKIGTPPKTRNPVFSKTAKSSL